MNAINEIELRTVKDVRLIRKCDHCGGSGMLGSLIECGFSGQTYDSYTNTAAGTPIKYSFHQKCYVDKFGFRKATKLPAAERSKFRIKDLTMRQMRRLLELGAPSVKPGEPK